MFKMFALKNHNTKDLFRLVKKKIRREKFRPFHVDSHKKAAEIISSFQQVVFRIKLRQKSENSREKRVGE
jgi:hypothetical protein